RERKIRHWRQRDGSYRNRSHLKVAFKHDGGRASRCRLRRRLLAISGLHRRLSLRVTTWRSRLLSFRRGAVTRRAAHGYPGRPSCFACRAVSQKAEIMMIRSPSHFVVWPNSTSKALPVGAITLPSGRTICPRNVPVARVITVIQSPLPNWVGYGVYTCMSGKI